MKHVPPPRKRKTGAGRFFALVLVAIAVWAVAMFLINY